ncbi:MAG: rRNA maturation RNase YbeY [Candidatus Cloacimonetes bacterium]|nr:rRNA maturation RNase YbeY [Candidatus Cloacimonadota bacterium]
MNTLKNKSVIIENHTNKYFPSIIFENILEMLVKEENLPKNCFVNLELSDDSSIRELNKKYLGRNELTDVISFQANIPEVPLLGDIIIDINVADIQKGTRTLEEELQVLFLHGVLHLLGYDHLSTPKNKIMRIKEKKYQEKLKEKFRTRG